MTGRTVGRGARPLWVTAVWQEVVDKAGLSDTQLARLDPAHLHAYCNDCAAGIAREAGHGVRAKPGLDTNQGDLLEGL